MSSQSLEERVATLEREIMQLKAAKPNEPGRDDWKKTVGMFPADDPIMKQIHEEGRKIREADRERASRGELGEGECGDETGDASDGNPV